MNNLSFMQAAQFMAMQIKTVMRPLTRSDFL